MVERHPARGTAANRSAREGADLSAVTTAEKALQRSGSRPLSLSRPALPRLTGFCAALGLLAGAGQARAADWPFEGLWDCEVGVFEFTETTYDPGNAPMEIVDVAPEGDTFTLTFSDNYQLSLAMNPDGTMTWYSPVSGDSFLCRRAP